MSNDPLFSSPRLFPVAHNPDTSDEYWTPPWVFEQMAITFDLDVCTPPGGVEWIPAARHYSIEDDGLVQPWEGRVWMNPPYSEAWRWVPRFVAHAHGVCLLPHAKSEWHPMIWRAADAVVIADRRVNFIGHRSNGEVMFPLFFAAFGDECADAIGRLGFVRRSGDA
jgi:hypothetical protein